MKLREEIQKEWTVTDRTGMEGELVYVVARNGVDDMVFDSRQFARSVAESYRRGRIEEALDSLRVKR